MQDVVPAQKVRESVDLSAVINVNLYVSAAQSAPPDATTLAQHLRREIRFLTSLTRHRFRPRRLQTQR